MAEWQRWKNIMKCYPFEEKRLAKWNPPYIVQPKYDGDRCKSVPLPNNTSLLLSSEENIWHSVPHINEDIDKHHLNDLPLDGELYSHDLFLEGGHELIHSICSRTVNIHPRHREMQFWLFDLQIQDKLQLERLIQLTEIENTKYIKIAPFWICHTLDEIKKVYDTLVSQRYEGIIVRNIHNNYSFKRSTLMMKFKPKQKDEYIIVGWNEEVSKDGVPKGRIGSLVMSSQKGDIFSVSAGLNDEDRDYLWELRGFLSGIKATVHYQHLTNRKVPKGSFKIEIPELGIGV